MCVKLAAHSLSQEREGESSHSLGVWLIVEMSDVALEQPVEDGCSGERHQQDESGHGYASGHRDRVFPQPHQHGSPK